MRRTVLSTVCLSASALAFVLVLPTASAQVEVISPSGISPGQPAPAPAPAPAPQSAPQRGPVIEVPVDGQADGSVNPADDLGYYHTDDLDAVDRLFGAGPNDDQGLSPAASHHVVRQGDTLWDICWFYFNNPWEWPKIWSYNPHITNPHWIYPGDLVRLYPKGLEPSVTTDTGAVSSVRISDPEASEDEPSLPAPVPNYAVKLRQTAFVERGNLDFAGTVVGAVEEKSLLSFGDEVYIEYQGTPPKAGDRFTIYTETQSVEHPKKKGKVVGAYVKILGELRVESVKKDKRARAVITDSIDIIERGARVGPVQRTYRTVEPQRNEVDLQGTIVALLGADELIGQGHLIFIDQGERAGVKVGNRMYVIRRGDAYGDVMGPAGEVGQDDRRFPARAIGEIIIVQTDEQGSVAMVTLATHELGVGDLVLMRKARAD